MHKLFVYGILRADQNKLVAKNVLLPATMYDLGPFPAITKLGVGTAIGDVIEVDNDTLAQYDAIEGIPTLYKRMSTNVPGIGHVYIYVYQHEPNNKATLVTEWKQQEIKR
jgi:gamma-glutamylcyclotransferase (GGCT)/AIG2-like uncharacterized protein YtfP